ncbi:DUF899 domain-containing protein [Actinokineospora bangkokensis]|uniref:Thioredoxin domain-containing protein n=1 Tax=Actinokineospora bangkokensis TaxID=1193682 RepID=A0A1Q9LMS1_9PSEU|nr:DUF899 domain-containing protein [Actinokineospora bangkokensis]OLR93328.1 hypothetical protein BJP25_17800 [Actinokineospora bangkokensis]
MTGARKTEARPAVVDRADWEADRAALLAREKELTRLSDAVAAERRRLPMTPVPEYTFDGPDGPVTLRELFGDREQLVVQNFMFDPTWDEGCPSCSNLADNVPHLAHFGPYGIAFARVSEAPVDKLSAYQRRMGWQGAWVSSLNSPYNREWGWTTDEGQVPGVSFYVRTGDDVFLTYTATARGVEPLSGFVGYLDRTVFGRQEDWEDSPEGWPQGAAHEANKRHDEYEV